MGIFINSYTKKTLVSSKLTFDELKTHLWSAADVLRGSLDANEYRQPIMTMLFLKRLNDQFIEKAEQLEKEGKNKKAAWEDPDYHAFFIPKNARWIYKKQLLVKEEKPTKLTFEHGSRLPFFGRNYLLDLKETKKTESFSLKNGKFVVRMTKISKTKVQKLYLDWLKQKALPLLEKSVKKYSKKIGTDYSKILIKNQKNRWGSVSKKGTINFNQKLIRAPSKIVDYVVAHEVCHLKIPNHSKAYWKLLGSIMPDFNERKQWLRLNRSLLE